MQRSRFVDPPVLVQPILKAETRLKQVGIVVQHHFDELRNLVKGHTPILSLRKRYSV